jgi:hypothetical protein
MSSLKPRGRSLVTADRNGPLGFLSCLHERHSRSRHRWRDELLAFIYDEVQRTFPIRQTVYNLRETLWRRTDDQCYYDRLWSQPTASEVPILLAVNKCAIGRCYEIQRMDNGGFVSTPLTERNLRDKISARLDR